MPALEQTAQGITVLVEGAGNLVDRPGLMFFVSFGHVTQHGSAVGEVDAAFWAWNSCVCLAGEFEQWRAGGFLEEGIVDSLPG